MTTTSEQVLGLIRNRVTHPASIRELIQALKIPREERVAFRRQLKQLVLEGQLVFLGEQALEPGGHVLGLANG